MDTYIYIIKCKNLYKIGISERVKKRFQTFNTSNPFELELIFFHPVKLARIVEKDIHHKFSEKRIKGEWFKLNKKDLNSIMSELKEIGMIITELPRFKVNKAKIISILNRKRI